MCYGGFAWGFGLAFLSLPSGLSFSWALGSHPESKPPGPARTPSTPAGQQRKPVSGCTPVCLWARCANITLHTQDLILSLLHSAGIISAHVRPLVSNDF